MDLRKPPLSPAFFRYKSARLNWRQIQTANFEELVKKANTLEIQELLKNLASAHLDEEEIARFRGPALLRLLELTQKGVQLLAGSSSNSEAEGSVAGVKCPQCAKRFVSEEYINKHLVRRHSVPCSSVPAPSAEPLLVQKAVGFLQEEFEQIREASEKHMGETLSGLQFLVDKAETLASNRSLPRPKSASSPGDTLNLLRELAKAQKQLLELDTLALKQRFPATPETPPTAPTTVRAEIIEEELDFPVKRALFVSDQQAKATLSEAEIEVEFTDSSESQQALQAAAQLIGFDLYLKPQYRGLAESLLQSPIPPPWMREDTGVSMLYRNTKTWETSLFHPKLEAYQQRYRLLERAKTLGASMRLELVDDLLKIRSLEGKYDGRMMNYFPHNEGEISRKRAEMEVFCKTLLVRVGRTDESFELTRERMKNELNRLFLVRKRTEEAAISLEEASVGSVKGHLKKIQSSQLPAEPQNPSISPNISLPSQPNPPTLPFSRFFLTPSSSLLHQGTLIDISASPDTWVSKSLRDLATVHSQIAKSDSVPALSAFSAQFAETELVLSLTGRWNGVGESQMRMVWRGPPRSEIYDIEW